LFGEVLIGGAGLIGAQYSKARSYCGVVLSGEARYVMVEFCPVMQSKVRSYCGMVWNREALHSLVKFCPVKHGSAGLGITWSGDVRWSAVRKRAVMQAKALFWQGGVLRGSVGRCLVMCAKALFGDVKHSLAGRSSAWSAKVLLRSCVVRSGTVGSGFARLRAAEQALVKFYSGRLVQGGVKLCVAWFGNLRNIIKDKSPFFY
jgi:hypothetical protein